MIEFQIILNITPGNKKLKWCVFMVMKLLSIITELFDTDHVYPVKLDEIIDKTRVYSFITKDDVTYRVLLFINPINRRAKIDFDSHSKNEKYRDKF